jgi:hypothetical protein
VYPEDRPKWLQVLEMRGMKQGTKQTEGQEDIGGGQEGILAEREGIGGLSSDSFWGGATPFCRAETARTAGS